METNCGGVTVSVTVPAMVPEVAVMTVVPWPTPSATPAAVIVIDTLSKIIPDDTYLTELRIDDHKLEISGLTHDAASLIAILERSQQFTNASFNAPTTHSPSEAREHFDIEANIQPTFPSAR